MSSASSLTRAQREFLEKAAANEHGEAYAYGGQKQSAKILADRGLIESMIPAPWFRLTDAGRKELTRG